MTLLLTPLLLLVSPPSSSVLSSHINKSHGIVVFALPYTDTWSSSSSMAPSKNPGSFCTDGEGVGCAVTFAEVLAVVSFFDDELSRLVLLLPKMDATGISSSDDDDNC